MSAKFESAYLCKSVEKSDSVILLQNFSAFLKIFYAAFVSYIKIKSQFKPFPIFIYFINHPALSIKGDPLCPFYNM